MDEKTELVAQVKELREKIVSLVMQREDILLQKNPLIEADYMVKIGAYEVKMAEAELAVRRAKKKLALCQSRANADEDVVEDEVEEELDAELEQWMLDLSEKQMKFYSLLDRRSKSSEMGKIDSKRLKELYRKLCKKLHPDLNPLLSDQERNLFTGVQKAYEQGDVATLEAYAWILEDEDEVDDESKDVEELIADVALLEAQVSVQEEMLEKVKNSYPYNMLDKLSNANWVFKTVQELKTKTKEFEDAKLQYDIKIRDILKRQA